MMTDKITVPVEFEIGTIEELGMGGLKTEWVSAEHDGAQLALYSGAGLGNPVLEASCQLDGRYLYAQARITGPAQVIFAELERRMRETARDTS